MISETQTITLTGTEGDFTLSLPAATKGSESPWIKADVINGDSSTNSEVEESIEAFAGKVIRLQ